MVEITVSECELPNLLTVSEERLMRIDPTVALGYFTVGCKLQYARRVHHSIVTKLNA